MRGMSLSSPAPKTREWLAHICSTSVVPDRGIPTMNTGSSTWRRTPPPVAARAARSFGSAGRRAWRIVQGRNWRRLRAKPGARAHWLRHRPETPRRIGPALSSKRPSAKPAVTRSESPSSVCSAAVSCTISTSSLACLPVEEDGRRRAGRRDRDRAASARTPRPPRTVRASAAPGPEPFPPFLRAWLNGDRASKRLHRAVAVVQKDERIAARAMKGGFVGPQQAGAFMATQRLVREAEAEQIDAESMVGLCRADRRR